MCQNRLKKSKNEFVTWEEALGFASIVEDIASEWAYRCKDESLRDDIAQTLYIGLVEKVDPRRAKKDVRVYVRAACWKMAEKFCNSRNGVWKHVSLDSLGMGNLQIDEEGELRPIYGYSDSPLSNKAVNLYHEDSESPGHD